MFHTFILWPYYRFKFDPVRHALIKNRKILILGSGSSLNNLKDIPEDIVILTCNSSFTFLKSRNPDLLLTCKGAIEKQKAISESLRTKKTHILSVEDLRYIQKNKQLSQSYEKLLFDDGKDNYFLKKIIAPLTIEQLISQNISDRKEKIIKHTSSGLRLLQYGLYFGASEIYLAGIDLNEEGYFSGQKNKHKHIDMDRAFMEWARQHYSNIYSAVSSGPAMRYFTYKKWNVE